jgi:hypothetical protein
VCGDARLEADEGGAGRFTRFRGKKSCEMLKKLVNGFAKRTRKHTALMALIKTARTDRRLIGSEWEFCACGLVTRWQAAQARRLQGKRHDMENVFA